MAPAQEDEPKGGMGGRLIGVPLEREREEVRRAPEVLRLHRLPPPLEERPEVERVRPRAGVPRADEGVAGDRATVSGGIRESVDLGDVPEVARGTALVLLIAGSLSLAFMGFAGLLSSA